MTDRTTAAVRALADSLSREEADAIFAALRYLQCGLEHRPGFLPVDPNDGDVGEILTNSGDHDGLTVAGIERLIDKLFAGGGDPDVMLDA